MPFKHDHKLDPSFIFQHGWGFSDTCWQGWIKGLSTPFLLGNRGYWGAVKPVGSDRIRPGFVLVCHSLGLHFLPPRLVSQAGLLVVISGFAHFHGQNPADGRFSRKHTQKMRSRLTVDPIGLLQDFYRDCSVDWPIDAETMDTKLLAQDLLLLDQNRIDAHNYQRVPPVLLLHGSDDRIVRPERAEELAGMLGMAQLTVIDGAGHGLPFTHTQLCLNLIRDFCATNGHEIGMRSPIASPLP